MYNPPQNPSVTAQASTLRRDVKVSPLIKDTDRNALGHGKEGRETNRVTKSLAQSSAPQEFSLTNSNSSTDVNKGKRTETSTKYSCDKKTEQPAQRRREEMHQVQHIDKRRRLLRKNDQADVRKSKKQRKKWKKHNNKTVLFDTPRDHVIKNEPGFKTLNIASLNPDDMTTHQSRNDITIQLRRKKIHIAIIQETHIAQNATININDYVIHASAALKNTMDNGKAIGGVAIAIEKELNKHLHHLNQIDHRTMTVTLHSDHSHTPLTIVNSYAPHSGYSYIDKKTHWQTVNSTLSRIPKTNLIIWGADANGQISHKDNTQSALERKIVGEYTFAEKTEKGNGQLFKNTCTKQNMIPMNTWRQPKQYNKSNGKVFVEGETKRLEDHTNKLFPVNVFTFL